MYLTKKQVYDDIEQNKFLSLKNSAFYLRNNEEVVLKAIRVHWLNLRYANKRFRDDKNINIAAIRSFNARYNSETNSRNYYYCANNYLFALIDLISKKLLDDIDIIKEIASIPTGFKYIKKSFWEEKEIALLIVENHPLELENLCEDLKKDRDIVLRAVKVNGNAIFHADSMYFNDEEVVLLALKSGCVTTSVLKERVGKNVLDNPEIALIFIENEREGLLRKQKAISDNLLSSRKSAEHFQQRIIELEEEQIQTESMLDQCEQDLKRLRTKPEISEN